MWTLLRSALTNHFVNVALFRISSPNASPSRPISSWVSFSSIHGG